MLEPVKTLLNRKVRSIRMIGSGALDLCFVACGRLDAVYAGLAGEGYELSPFLSPRTSISHLHLPAWLNRRKNPCVFFLCLPNFFPCYQGGNHGTMPQVGLLLKRLALS